MNRTSTRAAAQGMLLDNIPRNMRADQRTGRDRRRARPVDEERLRSIVERMADGIIVVNVDGVIRFANPAAERLFARSSRELVDTYFGSPAVAGESAEIDV